MIYRLTAIWYTCYASMIYFRFAQIWYNIRSFIRRRRISSHEVRYHTEGISPVPAGTDIIVKNHFCLVDKSGFLHGAGGGGRTRTSLRTTDFESVKSANSITPARCLYIISHFFWNFKSYFHYLNIFVRLVSIVNKREVFRYPLYVGASEAAFFTPCLQVLNFDVKLTKKFAENYWQIRLQVIYYSTLAVKDNKC